MQAYCAPKEFLWATDCLFGQASYAEVNGNWTRAIFDGTADVDPERMFPDLLQKKVPGAEAITFEDFRHAACLVTESRIH
jgi:hypothetical protein